MAKSDLVSEPQPNGWNRYSCTYPGCPWTRMSLGDGSSAEREGLAHVQTHVSDPEMKTAEFMTVRGGMGNDAFVAHANLVNVARAMFANEGINLKTVEKFRCSVSRNHDFDEVQGGTVLPMWDTFAEVIYPAPADDKKEDER